MTTKCLDNKKFALSKLYCRGVSDEKQRFGQFSSLPPPPSKSEKFIIIVVSPSLSLVLNNYPAEVRSECFLRFSLPKVS